MQYDIGLIEEIDGNIVAAVWVRVINNHGHVVNEFPPYQSLYNKEFQGLGIGTAMMKEIRAFRDSTRRDLGLKLRYEERNADHSRYPAIVFQK